MANQGSIFEDLAPYASMIVDQGRGVTVADLAFASAQDYWSTCAIPLTAVAGTVAANNEEQLFQTETGAIGQGFTVASTISQTNNVNGDRMPSNQVYVGLKCGFNLYNLPTVAALTPYNLFSTPTDLAAVADNFAWTLNVGDGIKRDIGSLIGYPAGTGIYAATPGLAPTTAAAGPGIPSSQGVQNGGPNVSMRKLPLPVIFPPNIRTAITVRNGNQFVLNDTTALNWVANSVIAIKMTFRGYMMTLPA